MRQLKKPKTIYICQKCSATTSKWVGKCPECGEWNTIIEELISPVQASPRLSLGDNKPIPITQVKRATAPRLVTNIKEFDRIVGGGIVLGSTALIGGDPGIGKSTLLLQICHKLASAGTKILYVSAEESVYQTKLRTERLNISSDNLWIVSETNILLIAGYIEQYQPQLVVIDSIQMVYKPEIPTTPGTVTQVRESAMDMVYLCKRKGICLFLIGHLTKEGSLAGPKTLEHLVDTVLYFEGDRFQSFRILRAIKNRFGSTNEIGIFEMSESGLEEVANPSELFITQADQEIAGTLVISTLIGTRPFLVELQALTSRAYYAVPARRVSGLDFNRTVMALAVLERRLGLPLGSQDVYVNVVGGVKVDEPAADLGIAMAVYSNYKNKPIPKNTVFIGEIGLTGEIRPINHIEIRLAEAARLGFKKIVIPSGNAKRLKTNNIEIIQSSYLTEVIKLLGE